MTVIEICFIYYMGSMKVSNEYLGGKVRSSEFGKDGWKLKCTQRNLAQCFVFVVLKNQ